MPSARRDNLALLVAAVCSLVANGVLILPAFVTLLRVDAVDAVAIREQLGPEAFDRPKPPEIILGEIDTPRHPTMTWIGRDADVPQLAEKSEVEQAALTEDPGAAPAPPEGQPAETTAERPSEQTDAVAMTAATPSQAAAAPAPGSDADLPPAPSPQVAGGAAEDSPADTEANAIAARTAPLLEAATDSPSAVSDDTAVDGATDPASATGNDPQRPSGTSGDARPALPPMSAAPDGPGALVAPDRARGENPDSPILPATADSAGESRAQELALPAPASDPQVKAIDPISPATPPATDMPMDDAAMAGRSTPLAELVSPASTLARSGPLDAPTLGAGSSSPALTARQVAAAADSPPPTDGSTTAAPPTTARRP